MARPTDSNTHSIEGVTAITSVTTVVNLVGSNISRRSLTIFNDSTSTLYVKFGEKVSSTDYKFKLLTDGFYEMPTDMVYTGVVTGTWATANGFAYVSEGND